MYAMPRFVAYAHAPRYGSRDEIVGSHSSLIAVAETEKWLDILIDRKIDPEWAEIDVTVEDNAPRSEWSPVIGREQLEKIAAEKELPF